MQGMDANHKSNRRAGNPQGYECGRPEYPNFWGKFTRQDAATIQHKRLSAAEIVMLIYLRSFRALDAPEWSGKTISLKSITNMSKELAMPYSTARAAITVLNEKGFIRILSARVPRAQLRIEILQAFSADFTEK